MSLFQSSSYPPDRLTWDQHFDSEPLRHGPEVPHIECNQRISPPIDGCFEDHLITRVPQLWAPQEVCFDRLRHRQHSIQEYSNFLLTQAGCQLMLGFRTCC